MYALLAERMDAADRVAAPVLLSVGMEPKDVEGMNQRDAFDRWLLAPTAHQLAAEESLARYLNG